MGDIDAPVARTACCGTTYEPHAPLDEQGLCVHREQGIVHPLAIGDIDNTDLGCRQALHRHGRCAVRVRYMGGRLCGEPTVSGDYCAEHAHDALEDARTAKAEDRADEARAGR